MSREAFYRAMITGLLIGAILAMLLFAFVIGTGSTFGQRCERIFPTDHQRAATCVDNLAAGRPA